MMNCGKKAWAFSSCWANVYVKTQSCKRCFKTEEHINQLCSVSIWKAG